MPPNVIHFAELAAYLETFKEKVLSYEQVVLVVGQIELARLDRSREVDEQHRNNVAERLAKRAGRRSRMGA